MELKAVFFDMGGTIDTFRYSMEYRLSKINLIRDCLQKIDISLQQTDEQLVQSTIDGAAEYLRWNMVSRIELKPEEIWSTYFLKSEGLSKEMLASVAEELAFLYETQLFIRELKPGIPEVLEKIKSMGLKIGCISNTQSLTQVPYSLQEYGIDSYFDPVVLSSGYGRRKPDPSIFYYAARLANLPTGSCVYIGDKINRDVLGSKRAGYRVSIQIKHQYDNGEQDIGAVPDAIIQDMEELLPILENELKNNKKYAGINSHQKVKALFFDAGDILYHRPDRNTNLNSFLEGKILNPHPDFEIERKKIKDMAFSGKIKRHDYYEKLMHLYGIQDQDEIQAGVEALSLDDNTVDIIEGVPATILELKQKGYLLGIITDTAFAFSKKLGWFEKYGFGHVWDCVISSKEIGVRKPAPDMYIKAIEQAGIHPEEAIFIGHKKTELDGAHEVGLTTIAFNYEENVTADYYIHQFAELLSLPILN